ncbi:MAG: efflux transporter outer membrane subunit [Alphaproteobacteria bacterium]
MRRQLLLSSLLLLPACSSAPLWKSPKTAVPEKYKEENNNSSQNSSWKKAEPQDKQSKGEWWRVFGDAKLNELQQLAMQNNQTLEQAAANWQEARAVAGIDSAAKFPALNLGADASRRSESSTNNSPYNLYRLRADLSYELDLFGKISDRSRSSALQAEAAEATYHSVMLSIQANVAEAYYTIRQLDEEENLAQKTVDIRDKARNLVEKRLSAGYSGELDASRARGELASAKADLASIKKARSLQEHALAILVGKAPADFTFTPLPLQGKAPIVPAGIPSALLERRPDIAAAEYELMAANARIGVAKAAFFPSIELTAGGGFSSTSLANLFQWSSKMWNIGSLAGSAINLPIFDGGRNEAGLQQAKAQLQAATALYRQQVLVGFREVEDSLSDLHYIREESVHLHELADNSRRNADLSDKRYQEGLVSYLDVVDSERQRFAAERSVIQSNGAEFLATIRLIRALGGGW